MFDDNRNNRSTRTFLLFNGARERTSFVNRALDDWVNIVCVWIYCQGTGTGIHIDRLDTTDSPNKIWSTNCMIMMMLGHQPKSTAIFERWHINTPRESDRHRYCCSISRLVDEKDDRTLFDLYIMRRCFRRIHVSPSSRSLETWHWLATIGAQRKHLGFVSSMGRFTCSWHSHQSSIYSLSITHTHPMVDEA